MEWRASWRMRENGGSDDQLPLLSDGAQIQVRGASGQGVLNTRQYLSIKINFLRLVFFSFSDLFQADSGVRLGLNLDLILLGPGLIL